jgi:hypothetical protein
LEEDMELILIASSLFGVGRNDRSCLTTDVFRFGERCFSVPA